MFGPSHPPRFDHISGTYEVPHMNFLEASVISSLVCAVRPKCCKNLSLRRLWASGLGRRVVLKAAEDHLHGVTFRRPHSTSSPPWEPQILGTPNLNPCSFLMDRPMLLLLLRKRGKEKTASLHPVIRTSVKLKALETQVWHGIERRRNYDSARRAVNFLTSSVVGI